MISLAHEQKEVAKEFRSLTKRTPPSKAPVRASGILTEKQQGILLEYRKPHKEVMKLIQLPFTGEFITEEFGLNLEKASITVIQIDEAALREVLPFKKSEHAFCNDRVFYATLAFLV
ncbi:hypothetical protein CK203_082469 [Vitis vinifera]|uniref:Cobalamin-independent methionine synthase MetE C-terminal/archaeal domain-containing protein n=1 Tax=Vitis vinifera TaxID=29760 RepID=A0A438BNI8_VITVI|nr:hypothetical protein CK203_082469 [Vitis vinifera]